MEFPPTKRRLALRLGVAPQTITNWQTKVTDLPKRENLESVADFVGRSYDDVLQIALSETGYAPNKAARTGRSTARQRRAIQDAEMTASQDDDSSV